VTSTTNNNTDARAIIEERIVRLLGQILTLGPAAEPHLKTWAQNVDLADVIDFANAPPDISFNAVVLLLLDAAVGQVRQARGLTYEQADAIIEALKPEALATWHRVFDLGESVYDTATVTIEGEEIGVPDFIGEAYRLIGDWTTIRIEHQS
jgi:hypothetical protein